MNSMRPNPSRVRAWLAMVLLTAFSCLLPPGKSEGAWLSGWCKRVKITILHDVVDSDLSHFPVLIKLSNSCGRYGENLTAVFTEVGANSKKIAVTQSDGETQLYVEIEKWDNSGQEAWLWVSKSGWTISGSANTDMYLYFCNTQSDNTTYVADSGSRTEVWDSSFRGVWHLGQTSGTRTDSTSNANTLTDNDTVTSNPGKIGTAGQFTSSTSESLSRADNASLSTGNIDFTISAWVYLDSYTGSNMTVASKYGAAADREFYFYIYGGGANTGKAVFQWNIDAVGGSKLVKTDIFGALSLSTWYYLTAYRNKTTGEVGINVNNGTFDTDTGATGGNDGAGAFYVGARLAGPVDFFNGRIDNLSISATLRSAAWMKASYNTKIDNLLDFGSVESIPATAVTLTQFTAARYEEGVLLRWQTGHEVNNLGFHIYREENGEFLRLTPEPVAGSALLAGRGAPLTAGRHYHWWDTSAPGFELSAARYWLKDVDLNGKETIHGPVDPWLSHDPPPQRLRPELLSEVGGRLQEKYRDFWKVQELRGKLASKRSAGGEGQPGLGFKTKNKAPLRTAPRGHEVSRQEEPWAPPAAEMQRHLAGRSAVKILVK